MANTVVISKYTLLPCPFCGGVKLEINLGWYKHVHCRDWRCDACGPNRRSEAKAVECWNKRALDEPKEA